jgi:hypothetical protein
MAAGIDERPRLNREWHLAHKLDRHANMDERIDWHVNHAANCSCRPIPPTVIAEMERRGLLAPTPRSLR